MTNIQRAEYKVDDLTDQVIHGLDSNTPTEHRTLTRQLKFARWDLAELQQKARIL